MYAGRVSCCLLVSVSHVEYADGTDRQTDGQTVTLRFLLGQRNKPTILRLIGWPHRPRPIAVIAGLAGNFLLSRSRLESGFIASAPFRPTCVVAICYFRQQRVCRPVCVVLDH